jgi:cytidine diphosphoramidate kinase
MTAQLYWFTGLSGAGKTTIGQLFYSRLKTTNQSTVFLDGDVIRGIFDYTQKYLPLERKKIAMTYSRLCKMLTVQGIDVVIATISMFHEVRDWNRQNIENYKEIYIKVPIEVLIEKDKKELYSRALRGEVEHVVGFEAKGEVEVEEPKNPDIVVVNDGSDTPEFIVDQLIHDLKLNI